jgi:hypothetical protein
MICPNNSQLLPKTATIRQDHFKQGAFQQADEERATLPSR